jgi:hypothetical protein
MSPLPASPSERRALPAFYPPLSRTDTPPSDAGFLASLDPALVRAHPILVYVHMPSCQDTAASAGSTA